MVASFSVSLKSTPKPTFMTLGFTSAVVAICHDFPDIHKMNCEIGDLNGFDGFGVDFGM